MAQVVIVGLEKMAQLAHFYLTHDSDHEVVAFSVHEEYIKDKEYLGLPVVPFETLEKTHDPAKYKVLVAVGYKKLNTIRTALYEEAKAKGYGCISYVSTKSILWGDTEIGENCFIFENQVIQPFVKIGNNVVMWSGNHLGHDVEIGDNCFLASHIIASGSVKIGPNCFVGINVSLRDNVQVGRESILGAGAVILRDVAEKSVYIAKQTDLYQLNSEQFERMMDISR